jgi:hypothetical protein
MATLTGGHVDDRGLAISQLYARCGRAGVVAFALARLSAAPHGTAYLRSRHPAWTKGIRQQLSNPCSDLRECVMTDGAESNRWSGPKRVRRRNCRTRNSRTAVVRRRSKGDFAFPLAAA